MNNLKHILWGIVLILIGVIIGLNALEITNINLFFKGWWTLLIIVPSFIGIFNDDDKSGNLIGVIIGILLFLSCNDIIDFIVILKLIIPIILITIGISCLFKNKKQEKIPNKENTTYHTVTFSNQNISYADETFGGCNIDAIFGGVKIDLTKAKISSEEVIRASAIFGNIKIIVPSNVKVVVKSNSIFGGITNKIKKQNDSKKTLFIEATCLFGGVEINDTDTKDN